MENVEQQPIDPETLEKLRVKGKESLFFFARAILGFSDLDEIIHKPICRELEKFEENTRLTIEFPRTWFKSTLGSISYSIWRAINNPNIRILIVQNSYDNACKKLAAIKSIFEKNKLFQALYPEILPTKLSRWSSQCLEVNRSQAHPEGTFEAAGIGTATTSRHYDIIIEDDTISPKKDDMTGIVQQPTQMDIEKAIGWHSVCHPMLLHPTKSQIVIIGTRWAERDLLGYIYEKFPEYKNLRRTACEKDGVPCTLDEGGKPTWPERFSEKALREIERQEGPYMFACLYLGKPTAAINQVFRRDWICYFENHARNSYACTSVDLASADKEESSDPDFNVILTTAIEPKSGKIYVLDYRRERMSPGEVIEEIIAHHKRHNPVKIKVEAIGYQRTLVHWLKQKVRAQNIMMLIEAITGHKQSKVDRIRGLQPYFANKQIYIRTWMTELEQELLAFPKGAHDDVIDTLSMQMDFWLEMMDFSKLAEPEKPIDQFSGAEIIKELRGRYIDINEYPNDMGNLRDAYLDNIQSPILRDDILQYDERLRLEQVLN